ncbi:Hypothetical predicted protein [Paramuricea clavata]|uniref:Uncharacterized protein n=1 Tax=Paramuricea clavata TaxID=317549 RepID=A0A6S7IFC0_PARCT|nr:Hypothetical predicted protein [Paramuricea clavata]
MSENKKGKTKSVVEEETGGEASGVNAEEIFEHAEEEFCQEVINAGDNLVEHARELAERGKITTQESREFAGLTAPKGPPEVRIKALREQKKVLETNIELETDPERRQIMQEGMDVAEQEQPRETTPEKTGNPTRRRKGFRQQRGKLTGSIKDLWLHKKQRDDMVDDGIASEATMKKISKDDAANDDAEATALFSVFGTKQKIRINKILKDHGLYAPHNMANDLQYVITIPTAAEIMNAQGGGICGRIHPRKHRTVIRVHRQHRSCKESRKPIRIRTRVILRTRYPNEENGMEQRFHHYQRNDQRTTKEYESHCHAIHKPNEDRQ